MCLKSGWQDPAGCERDLYFLSVWTQTSCWVKPRESNNHRVSPLNQVHIFRPFPRHVPRWQSSHTQPNQKQFSPDGRLDFNTVNRFPHMQHSLLSYKPSLGIWGWQRSRKCLHVKVMMSEQAFWGFVLLWNSVENYVSVSVVPRHTVITGSPPWVLLGRVTGSSRLICHWTVRFHTRSCTWV